MTEDFCIWCSEKKEYTEWTDSKNSKTIFCIICPKGHDYCLTKKYYEKWVRLGQLKGRQISLAQYDSYVKANKESSSEYKLVIGRDFQINYS